MKGSVYWFDRDELLRLKLNVRKRGVWFKALSRIDRVLIDVAIEVTDGVRSFRLAKELWSIMRKVEDALKNKVSQVTDKIGFPLARGLSMLAQKWGNKLAKEWSYDSSFARFLAIVRINDLGIFRQRLAIDMG